VFYAFAGADVSQNVAVRGNPCQVILQSAAPAQEVSLEMVTQCVTWPLEDDVCSIRCWSPAGTQIQLCGHGLLCSGVAWQRAGKEVSQLEMNGLRAAFHATNEQAWIGLPSLSCAATRVPHWIREFFAVPPWRAAQAGGDEGYLVLEWPEDFDLRTLPIPPYALHRRTRRSLIVTTRDTQSSKFDVKLRYFAPQHGVPEDTPTGSAMRVLPPYWMNRELNEHLSAQQCSRYGGELHSHIRGDLTWVGGRVSVDEGQA